MIHALAMLAKFDTKISRTEKEDLRGIATEIATHIANISSFIIFVAEKGVLPQHSVYPREIKPAPKSAHRYYPKNAVHSSIQVQSAKSSEF